MATLPPATIGGPTTDAAMIVGPTTLETEEEGPMKLRPPAVHDWTVFPLARPWPMVEVTHPPVGMSNPATPGNGAKLPGTADGSTMSALAAGAPMASTAPTTSATAWGLRSRIMPSAGPFRRAVVETC